MHRLLATFSETQEILRTCKNSYEKKSLSTLDVFIVQTELGGSQIIGCPQDVMAVIGELASTGYDGLLTVNVSNHVTTN